VACVRQAAGRLAIGDFDATPARPCLQPLGYLFGVCEALGEDLGFNPNILRIAFAIPVIWYPVPALTAYLGLGALVLLSRLLWPNPKVAAEHVEGAAQRVTEPRAEQRLPEVEPMAIAA
jgi:phage shock protein PspC (stress-responsive transcriptional regulator)